MLLISNWKTNTLGAGCIQRKFMKKKNKRKSCLFQLIYYFLWKRQNFETIYFEISIWCTAGLFSVHIFLSFQTSHKQMRKLPGMPTHLSKSVTDWSPISIKFNHQNIIISFMKALNVSKTNLNCNFCSPFSLIINNWDDLGTALVLHLLLLSVKTPFIIILAMEFNTMTSKQNNYLSIMKKLLNIWIDILSIREKEDIKMPSGCSQSSGIQNLEALTTLNLKLD